MKLKLQQKLDHTDVITSNELDAIQSNCDILRESLGDLSDIIETIGQLDDTSNNENVSESLNSIHCTTEDFKGKLFDLIKKIIDRIKHTLNKLFPMRNRLIKGIEKAAGKLKNKNIDFRKLLSEKVIGYPERQFTKHGMFVFQLENVLLDIVDTWTDVNDLGTLANKLNDLALLGGHTFDRSSFKYSIDSSDMTREVSTLRDFEFTDKSLDVIFTSGVKVMIDSPESKASYILSKLETFKDNATGESSLMFIRTLTELLGRRTKLEFEVMTQTLEMLKKAYKYAE